MPPANPFPAQRSTAWGCGRSPLALASAIVALACGGADAELDYLRGRNALALGQNDWARHYFAADLERHPERLESLRGMGLGWISGQAGSLSHGAEALERYAAARPDDAEARVHLGRTLYQLRRLEPALAALEGLGETLEVHLLRSRILLELAPEQALAPTEAALAAAPGSTVVHLQAAKVHRRLGRPEQALEHALEAAALDPLADEAHVLTANLHRMLGDEESARRALELHDLAYRLPARDRRSSLTVREQAEVLGRILERCEEPPYRLRLRLVEVLLAGGRASAATDWIEEVLAAPEATPADLARLAGVAWERGRPVLARRLYGRVRELQPDHLGALTQLILLAEELGDTAEAEALLAEAMALDPDHGPFHWAASRLALARGREEVAEEPLRRAVELLPWVARYRTALADLLLARGEFAAAREVLEEAPAPDPAIEAFRRRLAG